MTTEAVFNLRVTKTTRDALGAIVSLDGVIVDEDYQDGDRFFYIQRLRELVQQYPPDTTFGKPNGTYFSYQQLDDGTQVEYLVVVILPPDDIALGFSDAEPAYGYLDDDLLRADCTVLDTGDELVVFTYDTGNTLVTGQTELAIDIYYNGIHVVHDDNFWTIPGEAIDSMVTIRSWLYIMLNHVESGVDGVGVFDGNEWLEENEQTLRLLWFTYEQRCGYLQEKT